MINSYVKDLNFIVPLRYKAPSRTILKKISQLCFGCDKWLSTPGTKSGFHLGCPTYICTPERSALNLNEMAEPYVKVADVNLKYRLRNVVAITKRFQPIVG